MDFDQYGWCRDERNENLAASEYGAQIDPMGLRIVLNDYHTRYHVPMIVTEDGLGMADEVAPDGSVHDPYHIDYLRRHIEACALALGDGVELMGYSPWQALWLRLRRSGQWGRGQPCEDAQGQLLLVSEGHCVPGEGRAPIAPRWFPWQGGVVCNLEPAFGESFANSDDPSS